MTYFHPTLNTTRRSTVRTPARSRARAAARVSTGLGLSFGALASLGLWAALIHGVASLVG